VATRQQEALLLAGALLPPGAEPGGDAPLDPVFAYCYRHRLLCGQPVVRLTGETAAAGEQRLLGFLGFDPGVAGAPLARTLRRGLGYVEWVLVHDPARAEVALAVAAEVERATQLAPSRPLAATRLFEALARQLPSSHLPALWEHAGRAFLVGGVRRRWAAAMFERARVAERVHGLRVDPATSHQVYREFAVAGALRAGSVARHVAELRSRRLPEAASAALLELAPRLAGGGVPPWTTLPEQLHRAARAAGRDPDGEQERLLGRLLALPATRLAPAGFWRRCRPTLVRTGRDSAAVRGALLDLFPAPRHGRVGFHGWWLDLLDEVGALDGLTLPAGEVPAAAGPALGAAGWLGRFAGHTRRRWWEPDVPAQLFTLLPRMAARLAADGEPVVLGAENRGRRRIDANLADSCLEHGILLADPTEADEIDLHEWAASIRGGGVRRDLVFAAADPRFARLLQRAIPRFCRHPGWQLDDLLAVPALRPLVGLTLQDRVTELGRDGLGRAADLLDELAGTTSRRTFSRFPAVHAALAATDLAGPLARTLRAGLLDELGWSALEEALEELAGGAELDFSPSWPLLVVHDRVRAIAVGPGGRAAEHELRLTDPEPSWGRSVRYAGGQFLVRWYDRKLEREVAYWSGAPKRTFPLGEHAGPHWREGSAQGFAFLLPDGGRVAGGRALYPGDRVLEPEADVCWDGESFWVLDQPRKRDDQPALRRLDPRTGDRGRPSLPAFFADLAAGPGQALAPALCSLAPLPAGLEGTVLGQGGGLVGFRVAVGTREGRRVVTIEGTDGRRFVGPDPDPQDPELVAYQLARGVGPVGLVSFPGAAGPRLLSSVGRWTLALALWDPELTGPAARIPVGASRRDRWVDDVEPRLAPAATPFVAPPAFWHCLTPRDEAGSHALRHVTEELARELLAAGQEDLEARPPAPLAPVDQMNRTAATVARLLPAVSHPRLQRGIVGVVRSAALAQRRLGALADRQAPAASAWEAAMAAAEASAGRLGDDLLGPALAGLGGRRPGPARDLGPGGRTAEQLHVLGRFFAGELEPEVVEPSLRSALPWPAMLGRAGAVAFRAASDITGERDRSALLDLLALWVGLPFCADPCSFWTGRLHRWPALAGRSERGAVAVLAEHPGPLAVSDPWPRHGGTLFIERRHGEATALPAAAEVAEVRRVEAGWGRPSQLALFLRLVRERGPVPWDPAVPEALAARTGLTRAEAALLWAGLPDLDAGDEERDVLGPQRRRLLGVTVAGAAAARECLRRLDLDRRYELLAAVVPDDPAQLWAPLGAGPEDDRSPVGRLAAAWVGLFGRRRSVPEDALGEAAALGASISARCWSHHPRPAISLLEPLVDPAGEPALAEDRDWVLEESSGRLVLRSGGVEDDLGGRLVELAVLLPWAFATRPVGDPLRARLPEALTLARSRLAHPDLLLKGPHVHGGGPAGETLRREFGSRPYRGRGGTAAANGNETADDGLTVAVAGRQGWLALYFRPALLGEHDARAQRLRRWLLLEPGGAARTLVAAIDLLRGQGYAAMAERVRSTPVPPGGYEADPARSAPATVRAASAALGLEADAAVLYLQLLTLLEPTDRNVRRWNRWTPARHRQAAAELLAADLVLEARRPRAGRRLFLPGDWVPAAAPNLPLEAWKLPLYRLACDPSNGRPHGPLPPLVPLAPLHELFADAWSRVEMGDRPSHRPQGGTA
jgi:hypothetical protein